MPHRHLTQRWTHRRGYEQMRDSGGRREALVGARHGG